ncbi:MAG TPA: hypothetical protein VF810_03525 [Patescibacteria group bacterium]
MEGKETGAAAVTKDRPISTESQGLIAGTKKMAHDLGNRLKQFSNKLEGLRALASDETLTEDRITTLTPASEMLHLQSTETATEEKKQGKLRTSIKNWQKHRQVESWNKSVAIHQEQIRSQATEEEARPKSELELYQTEAAKIRMNAMYKDPDFQTAQIKAWEQISGKPSRIFYSMAPFLPQDQLDKINKMAETSYIRDKLVKEDLIRSSGIHTQAYQTEYFRLTASGMPAKRADVLAREVAAIKVCEDASADLGQAVEDTQDRLNLTKYAAAKFAIMNNPAYMTEFRGLIEKGLPQDDAQTLAFEHTKAKLPQNYALAA